MKLSEAMMLGSTLAAMKANDWNNCALGVAGTSMGLPLCTLAERTQRASDIKDLWPWLRKELSVPEKIGTVPRRADTRCEQIWMRFDFLVCNGEMTFEALVDYVRSIEPACGECNRFECTCAPKEAVPETKLVTAG